MKIISKLLILLLLFNTAVPLPIYAADETTIYNCGKVVRLDNEIEQLHGKSYIHEDDLDRINLEILSDYTVVSYDSSEMRLFPGGSAVIFNDITVTYPYATVETDDGVYICLELLAMFFSQTYEIDDTSIHLWISDFGCDFARGIISLPSGKTAPEGGIEVDVFVAEIPRKFSGGSGGYGEASKIGTAGYPQSKKPMYAGAKTLNAFLSYTRKASKTVVIPEGKNSVEYTLSTPHDDFENCIVGYFTEIDGEQFYNYMRYKGADTLYSFRISASKTSINGTVSIPETAQSNVKFRIVAHGDYDFCCDGVILAGNSAAEYHVNMSLPDDYTVSSVAVYMTVTVQSTASPYYVLDTKSVVLDEYTRSGSVSLYDDMQSKSVICYYELSNDYEGLFCFGHYTKNGTSFDSGKAARITSGGEAVNITLLKSKEINALFTLPDGDTAEEDIRINAYPTTVTYPYYDSTVSVVTPPGTAEEGDEVVSVPDFSGSDDFDIADGSSISGGSVTAYSQSSGSPSGGSSTSGVSISTAPIIIKEGENSGMRKISIPDEDGYGYVVEFDVSGGEEKYYDKIYYGKTKTSVLSSNAAKVNAQTDSINVELIRQFYISGKTDAFGFSGSENRITAAALSGDKAITDMSQCDFSVYTDVGAKEDYGLYLPEEFDKYILCLKSLSGDRTIYYKTGGCVDTLSDSEVLTVRRNLSDISFSYTGYNPSIPLMLTADASDTDACTFYLKNISDFDEKNVTVYIGFYDDTGRLIRVVKEYVGAVRAMSAASSAVTVPDEYVKTASAVRLYAWSGLKPTANVFFLRDGAVSESDIATVYAAANQPFLYHNGSRFEMSSASIIYNEALYLPVRDLCEALGWTVSWFSDTQKLILQSGEDTVLTLTINETDALLNGSRVELDYAPITASDRLMLPAECVASCMGYECFSNKQTGTVAIYDSIDYKVKSALANNLITDMLSDETFTDGLLRIQAASLIVNAYEKVSGKKITVSDNPFTDCESEDVQKVYSLGLMQGTSDVTFSPEQTLTRAEFLKVLHSLLTKLGLYLPAGNNTDKYTDLSSDDWSSGYVYPLKEIGILDGVYADTILPHQAVPIREALAVLNNAYLTFTLSPFSDVSPENPYKSAITNVANRGIMVGFEDGSFYPEGGVTRAEFSALIMRMHGKDPVPSTDFSCTDVQSSHWASGCIEYCLDKGIFSLVGGYFRPDDGITVGETVEALLNYCGHQSTSDINDKIAAAKKLGMLDKLDEDLDYFSTCSRGMMAQLIENTLNLN